MKNSGTLLKGSLNQKGFSLIELMVVVAIIGILATVAVPQVNKFMAKARQSEVKGNLAAIYSAEKAFFAEFNSYTSYFSVIGYGPEGNLRYNVGFQAAGPAAVSGYTATYPPVGAATDGSPLTAIDTITYCGAIGATGTLSPKCDLLSEAKALAGGWAAPTQTTFTAGGEAQIVAGNQNDRWQINQLKQITQTQNGID